MLKARYFKQISFLFSSMRQDEFCWRVMLFVCMNMQDRAKPPGSQWGRVRLIGGDSPLLIFDWSLAEAEGHREDCAVPVVYRNKGTEISSVSRLNVSCFMWSFLSLMPAVHLCIPRANTLGQVQICSSLALGLWRNVLEPTFGVIHGIFLKPPPYTVMQHFFSSGGWPQSS